MSEQRPTADTIDRLVTDLKPVTRLAPPAWRMAGWMALAAVVGAIAFWFLDGNGRVSNFETRPYIVASFIGSVLTAILAAVAAFELSIPGRSRGWAWLPAPAAVLWVVSAGLGCLAGLGEPDAWGDTFVEIRECFLVIVLTSVPVSVLMLVMLRRALPLAPVATALMGGLASAAAAGSVLILVHPHNSTVLDLGIHVVCFGLVIGLNGLLGGRLLGDSDRNVTRS